MKTKDLTRRGWLGAILSPLIIKKLPTTPNPTYEALRMLRGSFRFAEVSDWDLTTRRGGGGN